jgi:hypothetical protein
MVLTGRQAARLLRDVLSSDERGRLLLRTGIAGEPIPSPHGPMYERAAVEALRLRPNVDERDLACACPHGVWIARLPRSAALDLRSSWSDIAREVVAIFADQRPMTTWSAALVAARMKAWGPLPFVATFLGYVVLTADLVGLTEPGPDLKPPSSWARLVNGRRWHTPRGGRPHHVWTPSTGSSGRQTTKPPEPGSGGAARTPWR